MQGVQTRSMKKQASRDAADLEQAKQSPGGDVDLEQGSREELEFEQQEFEQDVAFEQAGKKNPASDIEIHSMPELHPDSDSDESEHLQAAELLFPRRWQGAILRRVAVKELLPLADITLEGSGKAGKGGQVVHCQHLVPSSFHNP